MVEKLDKIWMDGELIDWDDATVHVLTHSLHYGVAAFELAGAISKLSAPFEIAFAALAVVAIIGGAIFIRVNAKRLEAVAEAALPGPLEGFKE